MAWDSTRPVPWRRLTREWLIYVGLATAALLVWFLARGKKVDIGLFFGLLASGPMYLIFGYVLAKIGYTRKTYRDLRNQRQTPPQAQAAGASVSGSRPKPAPTKRTSTGPSQNRAKPKRR